MPPFGLGVVNTDTVMEFYDPHPDLPLPLRAMAIKMVGQKMPLRAALILLHEVGIGRIEPVSEFKYIRVEFGVSGSLGKTIHGFRVIRYREAP